MLNLTFPETDEMVDLYYGRLLWSDYLIEMKNLQLINDLCGFPRLKKTNKRGKIGTNELYDFIKLKIGTHCPNLPNTQKENYMILKDLQTIKTRRTNDVIYNYESETSFVHSPLSEIEQNLNLDNYPLQKKALNVTLESLMSLDFPDEGLTTDEIHRVIKLVERLDALKKIMINTTSL
jgi:hypothetical protein